MRYIIIGISTLGTFHQSQLLMSESILYVLESKIRIPPPPLKKMVHNFINCLLMS